MSLQVHYLQHVSFEGLGSIEPWLRSVGADVTGTRFFESTRLPNLDGVDLLVVMGGPMSANDEGKLVWLAPEKRFIRHAIESGKAVLGVCLGAQLIASAMGARVYPNREKEIGWFPITAVPSTAKGVFRFPPALEVFHWHGETFDLPEGAVRLTRSEGCENQAFQLGKSVIGLQFHLETTPGSARQIVTHCRSELVPSKYVQSEERILRATHERYGVINSLMAEVLSFLIENKG
jgi:GMP synthase-like glutamine amidotransferase